MTTVIDNEDEIRFVFDAKGNKTAVIIPIEIWNQWKEGRKMGSSIPSFSLNQYRGILKGKKIRGIDEETKMRDEWI